MTAQPHADALILFGISGDLAKKKLFRALYSLTAAGRLDLPVIGVASSQWDDTELVARAREALEATGDPIDEEIFSRLAANLCYVSGDYRHPDTYRAIVDRLGGRGCTVSYLAIPPALFTDVVEGLTGAGLNRDGRLVLEKPFGRDTKTATELSNVIQRHFPEERVYRIDHFLGKEAIQNLMIYRFSNTILEPIWNRHYIRGVQVTMAEDFGVEGRGHFYDGVGALRDVVQNHLLQLISLLAMEPPVSEAPDALRDERVKVLKATKALDPHDVVRGQYEGFRDEPGVGAGSETDTYLAARLEIDSWRWAGVPWIIRAGKTMGTTVTEAVVEFRRPPRPLFADAECAPGPNRLAFQSKPNDCVILSMQAKRPGQRLVSGPVDLRLDNARSQGPGRDPYDRLLGDALRGDPALFARQDGVMEAWRIVEPALDAGSPVHPYEQGTWGPKDADRLLGSDWEWATPMVLT